MRSRKFALGLALAVVGGLALAGCGSTQGTEAKADEASAEGPAAGTVAAARQEPGTPAQPYDAIEGRAEVTQNDDGTRTVTSDWGTATVPAEPQRIVTILGYVDFETMLALGVRPVGAGTQGGTVASGFAPHLADLTEGIEPLGWAQGAPVEKIASLRPDLILAPDEDSYNAVKDLAPTVPAGAALDEDWKGDARYIGAVLGLGDQAEQLIADHEERAADLRTRLEPVMEGRTVASPQVAYDHSQVYVAGDKAFSSVVMEEAGLTLAPVVHRDPSYIELSFENLTDLDADVLFWQVRQNDEDGSQDTEGLKVVEDSPLWPRVQAVRTGDVHHVDNRPWYFPTVLSAGQVLDDLEAALLD